MTAAKEGTAKNSRLAPVHDGIVQLAFLLLQPSHVIQEARDANLDGLSEIRSAGRSFVTTGRPTEAKPYPSIRIGQASQQSNHVHQGLTDDSSLHSRVEVGLVGGDLLGMRRVRSGRKDGGRRGMGERSAREGEGRHQSSTVSVSFSLCGSARLVRRGDRRAPTLSVAWITPRRPKVKHGTSSPIQYELETRMTSISPMRCC